MEVPLDMEERAQVSFEYLLTVLLSVILAMAASVLAFNVVDIASVARSRISQYRNGMISAFMS
ncbi:MAG: hypothetical protein WC602_02430 [archaeon]